MTTSIRRSIDEAVSYVLSHGRLHEMALSRSDYKEHIASHLKGAMREYVRCRVFEINPVPIAKAADKRDAIAHKYTEVNSQLDLFNEFSTHAISGKFNRTLAANEALTQVLGYIENRVREAETRFFKYFRVSVYKKTTPETTAAIKADFDVLVRERLAAW